jgi:hypothetical protein
VGTTTRARRARSPVVAARARPGGVNTQAATVRAPLWFRGARRSPSGGGARPRPGGRRRRPSVGPSSPPRTVARQRARRSVARRGRPPRAVAPADARAGALGVAELAAFLVRSRHAARCRASFRGAFFFVVSVGNDWIQNVCTWSCSVRGMGAVTSRRSPACDSGRRPPEVGAGRRLPGTWVGRSLLRRSLPRRALGRRALHGPKPRPCRVWSCCGPRARPIARTRPTLPARCAG